MRTARIPTTRFIAVAAGAAVVAALAMPATAAAATRSYSASQLTAVGGAVDRSDVAGIAWYVDAKSHRVVVTADSSVSAAGIAKLKRAAGADAGALRIQRTAGVFTSLIAAGDP